MQKIRYILASFSMFSSIPVRKELSKEDFKYAGAFLPFVGAALGLSLTALGFLCSYVGVNNFIIALIITGYPVIFTGGIHLDGFLDCHDAFASHRDKSRMLEIMKDSSIGAFAGIYLVLYLLSFYIFALLIPKDLKTFLSLASIFAISRSLAAFALLTMPNARDNGMGKSLKDASDSNSKLILILEFTAAVVFLISVDFISALIIVISAFISYFYCVNKMKGLFGGITGDLAGWLLTSMELSMLFGLVISTGGLIN